VFVSGWQYAHYFDCVSEGEVRFKLSTKYGNRNSRNAIVKQVDGPFKGFSVQVEFKYKAEPYKALIMAIEADHVKAMMFKMFGKKEIKKILIK
jgi:hypothetical protein